MKFRTAYCLPEQCVVRQGDPIQEIYFICSGTLEVVKNGKSIFTLGKMNGQVCLKCQKLLQTCEHLSDSQFEYVN